MNLAGLCLACRLYADKATAIFACGEHNYSVNKGIDCMILAHAYVKTRVVNCATLTFDNVAGFSFLTAKNLNAKSFAF
jgi:hypothetical protein